MHHRLTSRLALQLVSLVTVGCGVHEYPHERGAQSAADDFASPPPSDHVLTRAESREHTTTDAAVAEVASHDLDAATRADVAAMRDAAADAGSTAALGDAASSEAGATRDGGVDTHSAAPEPDTSPPDMPALVLDGVPLRKEDVLAFIHFGHSNMSGQATEPAELRPYFFTETHPRVWMYRVGAPPLLATEPTARVMRDDRAGPGVALLKQAAELAPDKYFMSLGFGWGGSACIHFTPGWPYFEEITKSAVAIKERVTFAAIVVMLGVIESGDNGRSAQTLPDCYVQLASSVREAVGAPDLPLLFSGYEMEGTGAFSPDLEGPRRVMTELAKVPGLVPNSALVPADGIAMQDDHHFNLTGHLDWTKRLLDVMLDKGWFPWADKSRTP